jgi:hypothetical protein
MGTAHYYNENTQFKNGFWILDSDYVCDYCNKHQPMSIGNKCCRCGNDISSYIYILFDILPIKCFSQKEYDEWNNVIDELMLFTILNNCKTIVYHSNFNINLIINDVQLTFSIYENGELNKIIIQSKNRLKEHFRIICDSIYLLKELIDEKIYKI